MKPPFRRGGFFIQLTKVEVGDVMVEGDAFSPHTSAFAPLLRALCARYLSLTSLFPPIILVIIKKMPIFVPTMLALSRVG